MEPKWLYEKLTRDEIDQGMKDGRVVLIPTGAIEQHGPHLPVDTDIVCARGICHAAAELIPDQVLVMPPIWFGYETHHMDFPATIDVGWELFIHYLLAVTKSLAHHGFKRILIVNGHGSNRPLIETAARQTTVERPDVICAALSWWELSDCQKAFNAVRDSEVTSHGCELETSAYLYLAGEYVQMEKARRDITFRMSPHVWSDLMGKKPRDDFKAPVKMMEYWSTVSERGVRGDPSVATFEKGRIIVESAARELAEIVAELKAREIRLPVDRHQL